MTLYVWLVFAFLSCFDAGVLQKRSTERCGTDFYGESRGEVHLHTEEFNGTGFYTYKPLEDCDWTISTGIPGTYIMLTSVYFSLEISDDCVWDYVEIEERSDNGAISRFCGDSPVTYISASNEVLIRFHSDESFELKGFKFTYDIKRRASVDDSQCNSTILGPDPGTISSPGASPCYYSIRASEGKVIELDLRSIGNRSCDEEKIQVFQGYGAQENTLLTLCNGSPTGFIGVRESVLFVVYSTTGDLNGGGFEMAYTFVMDNFTPSPPPATTPSPVGGNNDCSGLFIDPENGEMTYTSPNYEDNKHCIVVVKNLMLRNHVIEIKFIKFDLEESDDCIFDNVKVLSGAREDSAMVGGKHGKLYCGTEIKDRTLIIGGNTLRIEFTTDESLSFYGFTANIKFVPITACECDRPSSNAVCFRTGMEKMCVHGTACSDLCYNGGKCVRHQGENRCLCRTGFSGVDCSVGEDGIDLLHFVHTPEDRLMVRGPNSHIEECKAEVVDGDARISYEWTLDGTPITPFSSARGFGIHPGGMLSFERFNDQMEGTYSCIASTESGSMIEHFFVYNLIEQCPAGIKQGPKDKTMMVGQDVLLECSAPDAESVVWKKDGDLIDFNRESRFQKRLNNFLHIRRLEVLDTGTYRCEAKSKSGCYGYREGELSVIDVTPLNSYCGRTIYDEEPSPRISKGRKAEPAQYPWHVILRTSLKDQQSARTFCGGSLISQRWVITAAHCITRFKEQFEEDFGTHTVKLYIGSSNCYGANGIMRQPKQIIVHPHFGKEAFMDSDIALIELSSPVEYTKKIKPICIKEDTYNDRAFFTGMKLTSGKVAGCGQNWRKKQSEELEEIQIPYVDRSDCMDMFEESRENKNMQKPKDFRFTDKMFCSGTDIEKTGDTCKGDSGGALVMAAQYRWIQTGIVSFGIGCDRGNYGVYTNVGKFYKWIRDTTEFDKEVIEN